jgi:hypothetical protein
MGEVRKIVWASDVGKIAPDQPLSKSGNLLPARAALVLLEQFALPFVRKLAADTGSARIVFSVEYREDNRGLASDPGTDVVTPVVKRKYPDVQPFKTVGPEAVRGVFDLPCPKCKAKTGHSCQPLPIVNTSPEESGISSVEKAVRSFCHSERLDLLVKYREFSPEN